MFKKFSLAFAAVVLLAVEGQHAAAQTRCVEIKGMTQATFDPKLGSYVGLVWVSIGDEVLIGKNLPNDEPPATVCDELSCQDSGGRWRLDFGKGDTLTIQNQIATYAVPGESECTTGPSASSAGPGDSPG